ncbi:hypothetical protein E1193_16675 [Micromonospora sp. KC606]|uniref:hypothetical protein n=1 Tax=Micromonospora sp. KC606 TaxID=2530379 RepID=UPI0010539572|nr:hypothetical protein [Micromonospora sp. KC606]TDC80787.1 hypothetical protein E1193_16675 [Micromonospora sp. KC606]
MGGRVDLCIEVPIVSQVVIDLGRLFNRPSKGASVRCLGRSDLQIRLLAPSFLIVRMKVAGLLDRYTKLTLLLVTSLGVLGGAFNVWSVFSEGFPGELRLLFPFAIAILLLWGVGRLAIPVRQQPYWEEGYVVVRDLPDVVAAELVSKVDGRGVVVRPRRAH